MKLNKKIAVPFLSTVVGLSLIGGVGGAVAWYQYNSRVTASFIGTAVANSGVLQIGHMENSGIVWGRDYIQGDATVNKLAPVTFGQLNQDLSLPGPAYGYPEAGKGDYVTGWTTATANVDYVQFDIYLRAYQADANATTTNGYKQVVKDVYISDIVMRDAIADANKSVAPALRMHIDVDGGKKFLLAPSAVTDLALSSKLDLDRDGEIDKVGGYAWNEGRLSEVVYGNENDKQTATAMANIVQERDSQGEMPDPSSPSEKLICRTKENGEQKITITIWLEGWHKLNNGTSESAIWEVTKTKDVAVQAGLTFDVGKFR